MPSLDKKTISSLPSDVVEELTPSADSKWACYDMSMANRLHDEAPLVEWLDKAERMIRRIDDLLDMRVEVDGDLS